MARPVRIEYPGAIYHVVTRGNNRQRIFKDDTDRKTYLEKLLTYCEKKDVKLLCYCLLSNHVHLLLQTLQGNLSKLMQAFQTSYTGYYNRRHNSTGHVFEQRYKAFLVDRDNYLLQVSRYIHLNPVGASLVGRPQDHRWSSYWEYVGGGKEGLVEKEVVLEQFGGRDRVRRYREYVEGVIKRGEEWSKLPVVRQAFVGDESFAEQMLKQRRSKMRTKGHYSLREVIGAVCRVMKIEKEELARTLRQERVQRAREVFMYMSRQYSDVNLKEIAEHLRVRDISTVSHGVRRVEEQLMEKGETGKHLQRVLNKIHSLIQA
jgi:REP element-mobilizing transposase RayT